MRWRRNVFSHHLRAPVSRNSVFCIDNAMRTLPSLLQFLGRRWRRGRFICALIVAPLSLPAPVLAADPSGTDNRGITSNFVYDGAGFTNLAGGLTRASTYSGNLNLRLTADLDRLMNWSGMTIYADGLWIHGGQPSNIVGDAQGVSNISAPTATQFEELWLQKTFSGVPMSVLVGLYDLNSEFYQVHSAGLFLNSSFGIGPEFSKSGAAGPSIFPNPSVGIRLAYKPAPDIVMRAAILDGVPVRRPDGDAAFQSGDGALLVSEVAFLERPGAREDRASSRFRLGRFSMLPAYDNKIAIGAWHYTANYNDLSNIQPDGQPVRHQGSSGAYLIGDRVLSRNSVDPDRRTKAFLQLGLGDPQVNRFGSYVGVGVVRTGIFGRPTSDELGLGVAVARNGSHYLAQQAQFGIPTRKSETTIELTYLTQLKPWLVVQPDLQYVINPNTDPTRRNSLAFTLRFEIAIGP